MRMTITFGLADDVSAEERAAISVSIFRALDDHPSWEISYVSPMVDFEEHIERGLSCDR